MNSRILFKYKENNLLFDTISLGNINTCSLYTYLATANVKQRSLIKDLSRLSYHFTEPVGCGGYYKTLFETVNRVLVNTNATENTTQQMMEQGIR